MDTTQYINALISGDIYPPAIIEDFFDCFCPILWSCFDGKHDCSFCSDWANYYNEAVKDKPNTYESPYNNPVVENELYACESCMFDIENGEIDIFNYENHPVSTTLYQLFSNWCNHNYWNKIEPKVYFDVCGIEHNICDICGEILSQKDNIAGSFYDNEVAHEICALRVGFNYTIEALQTIFENLQLNIKFNETPYYTPPLCEDDKLKLRNLTVDNFDFSPLRNIIKYWNENVPRSLCTVCGNVSLVENTNLQILLCENCHLFAPDLDIKSSNLPEAKVIRDSIKKWTDKNFHINITYRELHNNYNITYCRCMICKEVLDYDEELFVTDITIAHQKCLPNSSYCYHSNLPLNIILDRLI